MVEEGLITSTHVNLTGELETRFNKLWKHLLGKSMYFSPDVFKRRVVLISTYLKDQPVKVSIMDGTDKANLALIGLLLGVLVA